MNEYVKQSIDARKQAIFAGREVNDVAKKQIDELFGEIEKFGAKYQDIGQFETEFASSPLNQKYIDLMTKISTGEQASTLKKTAAKSIATGIADRVSSGAISAVKQTLKPTRAAIHQAKYDAARKVPVLGDALDIKNKVDTVKHFGKLFGFGKKKSKNDED